MILKPANRYQIIRQNFKNVLISDFQHHLFLNRAKVLETFFTDLEITNCEDETINHPNIYLLFDLFWLKESSS